MNEQENQNETDAGQSEFSIVTKLRQKTCGEISCDQCNEERESAADEIERLQKNIIADLQDRAIYAEKRALELAREVGVWRDVVDQVRSAVEETALLAEMGESYTGESIRAWVGRLREACYGA